MTVEAVTAMNLTRFVCHAAAVGRAETVTVFVTVSWQLLVLLWLLLPEDGGVVHRICLLALSQVRQP